MGGGKGKPDETSRGAGVRSRRETCQDLSSSPLTRKALGLRNDGRDPESPQFRRLVSGHLKTRGWKRATDKDQPLDGVRCGADEEEPGRVCPLALEDE